MVIDIKFLLTLCIQVPTTAIALGSSGFGLHPLVSLRKRGIPLLMVDCRIRKMIAASQAVSSRPNLDNIQRASELGVTEDSTKTTEAGEPMECIEDTSTAIAPFADAEIPKTHLRKFKLLCEDAGTMIDDWLHEYKISQEDSVVFRKSNIGRLLLGMRAQNKERTSGQMDWGGVEYSDTSRQSFVKFVKRTIETCKIHEKMGFEKKLTGCLLEMTDDNCLSTYRAARRVFSQRNIEENHMFRPNTLCDYSLQQEVMRALQVVEHNQLISRELEMLERQERFYWCRGWTEYHDVGILALIDKVCFSFNLCLIIKLDLQIHKEQRKAIF